MESKDVSSKQQFVIAATIIGNALEWFDVTLLSLIAPLIITIFLPKGSFSTSLFSVLMFVLLAIARPIGGLVFGYLGDKMGRRAALLKAIILMTIPIFLIAILPSYSKIGVSATIVLALILFIQGFSLGGEFPGSLVFLTESSNEKNQGYVGSWGYFGIYLGIFLAAVEIYLLRTEMPPKSFDQWGWRIPFFFAAVIGLTGICLRRLLHETTYFRKAKQYGYLVKEPILDALHKYKKNIFQGIGLFILDTVGFNLVILFSSAHFVHTMKLSYASAYRVNLCTLVIFLISTPLFGKLSMRIGCKRLAKWTIYGLLLLAFPLYFIMATKLLWTIYLGQGLLAILLAAYFSTLPALICSLFPPEVRYSGTSIVINAAVGIFGAAGPLIMTYFVIGTGIRVLPSLYLVIGSLISLYTLFTIKDERRKTDIIDLPEQKSAPEKDSASATGSD